MLLIFLAIFSTIFDVWFIAWNCIQSKCNRTYNFDVIDGNEKYKNERNKTHEKMSVHDKSEKLAYNQNSVEENK